MTDDSSIIILIQAPQILLSGDRGANPPLKSVVLGESLASADFTWSSSMKAMEFHVADVLSVLHGHVLGPRLMEGIKDLLCFLTGQRLTTNQIPRATREVHDGLMAQAPESLRNRFPERDDVKDFIEATKATYGEAWHDEAIRLLETEYGKMIAISPVATYLPDDPAEELFDQVGPEKIRVVRRY